MTPEFEQQQFTAPPFPATTCPEAGGAGPRPGAADGVEVLSASEQHLWRSLGRVAHTLPRVFEDAMLRATGLTMTEFGVLAQLRESPERTRSMSELAAGVGLSASRMTRVVAGLASRALVSRARHSTDARSTIVGLTAAGRDQVELADASHTALARRYVLDHVPSDAVDRMGGVLAGIADAATTGPPPTRGA